MTPNELRRFREMQQLRAENREMEIMMRIWGVSMVFAAVLISIWGW